MSPGIKEWLDVVIVPALVREWLEESGEKRKPLVNPNEDMPDFKMKKNGPEVIQ